MKSNEKKLISKTMAVNNSKIAASTVIDSISKQLAISFPNIKHIKDCSFNIFGADYKVLVTEAENVILVEGFRKVSWKLSVASLLLIGSGFLLAGVAGEGFFTYFYMALAFGSPAVVLQLQSSSFKKSIELGISNINFTREIYQFNNFSKSDELRKLDLLRKDGLLNDQEFEIAKAKILAI